MSLEDLLGWAGHQLDSATEQLGEGLTDFGKTARLPQISEKVGLTGASKSIWHNALEPTLDFSNYLYRQGISRPVATMALLQDDEALSPRGWRNAWDRSREISGGQAAWWNIANQIDRAADLVGIDNPFEWAESDMSRLWGLNPFFELFGDDIEKSYEEITGSGQTMLRDQYGGMTSFDILDPVQRKHVFDHGLAQFMSGTIDAVGRWYLDPLVIGGKIAAVTRRQAIIRPIPTRGTPEDFHARLDRIVSQPGGRLSSSERFDEWARYYVSVGDPDRTFHLLMRDATIRNNPDTAALLAQHKGLDDFKMRARLGMDGTLGTRMSTGENAALAYVHLAEVAEKRLKSVEKDLARYEAGYDRGSFGDLVDPVALAARRDEARRLLLIAQDDYVTKRLMARAAGTITQVPRITTGRRIGDKFHDIAGVDWVVWQPSKFNPMRIIRAASSRRPGVVVHDDAAQAYQQQANLLQRTGALIGQGIDEKTVAEALHRSSVAHSAGSIADRVNATLEVERLAMVHVARAHGMSEELAENLAREMRVRREAVLQTFRSRREKAFSGARTAEDELDNLDAAGNPIRDLSGTEPQFSGRRLREDDFLLTNQRGMAEADEAAAAAFGLREGDFLDTVRKLDEDTVEYHAIANSDLANTTPLIDIDRFSEWAKRHQITLRGEKTGAEFNERLDAMLRGSLGPPRRPSALVEEALDHLNRVWKPAQLLRLGWPMRVVLDEQMRTMSVLGAAAHIATVSRSLSESLAHGDPTYRLKDLATAGRRRIAERRRQEMAQGRPVDADDPQTLVDQLMENALMMGHLDTELSRVQAALDEILQLNAGQRLYLDARAGADISAGRAGRRYRLEEGEALEEGSTLQRRYRALNPDAPPSYRPVSRRDDGGLAWLEDQVGAQQLEAMLKRPMAQLNSMVQRDINSLVSEKIEVLNRVRDTQVARDITQSVVRNPQGELLTVYHGTDRTFSNFRNNAERGAGQYYGKGHYFTEDIGYADGYGHRVIEANLHLRNPFRWDEERLTPEEGLDFFRRFAGTDEELEELVGAAGYYGMQRPDRWVEEFETGERGVMWPRDNYTMDQLNLAVRDVLNRQRRYDRLGEVGDEITAFLKARGHDGIKHKDHGVAPSWVVFDSANIFPPHVESITPGRNPMYRIDRPEGFARQGSTFSLTRPTEAPPGMAIHEYAAADIAPEAVYTIRHSRNPKLHLAYIEDTAGPAELERLTNSTRAQIAEELRRVFPNLDTRGLTRDQLLREYVGAYLAPMGGHAVIQRGDQVMHIDTQTFRAVPMPESELARLVDQLEAQKIDLRGIRSRRELLSTYGAARARLEGETSIQGDNYLHVLDDAVVRDIDHAGEARLIDELEDLHSRKLEHSSLDAELTGRRDALEDWMATMERDYQRLVSRAAKPSATRRGDPSRPAKFSGTFTLTDNGVSQSFPEWGGGPFGPMWIDLASAQSTTRAMVALDQRYLAGMRTVTGDNVAVSAVIPPGLTKSERTRREMTYDRSWERAANDQIGKDPMMRLILQGKSPEEVRAWMRTPAGAEYVSKADSVRAANPAGWIQIAFAHVNSYLPTQELRDLALAGRAQASDLRKVYAGRDPVEMPVVHGESIDAVTSGSKFWSMYSELVDNAYARIGTAPTDVLSRQPFASAMYEREMQRQFLALKLQPNDTIPPWLAEEMERSARQSALREVKRTLYDVANESNLSHAFRFVMPFYAAWQDALQTWARLWMEDPSRLAHMVQAWEAPQKSGTVYTDPDGKKFINVPLPDFVKKHIPGEMIGGMSADAMRDLIFQGKYWYLPGFGPPVSVPVSELVRNKPTLADTLEPIIPYGAGEDVWDQILPAGWRRLKSRWDKDGDEDYAKAKVRIWADVYTDNRLGKTDLTDDEMWAEVERRANALLTVRAAANFLLPFSPTVRSPYQFYIDQWRIMSEQYRQDPDVFGGKTAQDNFLDEFGSDYFAFTLAATKTNIGGIPTTERGYELFKEFRDLVQENPDLGSLIIGDAAGEYSTAVANWMQQERIGPGDTRRLREIRDPRTAQTDAEINQGWSEFRKLQDKVDAAMRDRGVTSLRSKAAYDIALSRSEQIKQIAEDYPAWAAEFGTFDRDKADRRVAFMEKLVNDPRTDGRPGFAALAQYLAFRRIVVRELAARKERGGSANLQALQNKDLRERFDAQVNRLRLGDTEFATIHARWLASDNLDTGGTAL